MEIKEKRAIFQTYCCPLAINTAVSQSMTRKGRRRTGNKRQWKEERKEEERKEEEKR